MMCDSRLPWFYFIAENTWNIQNDYDKILRQTLVFGVFKLFNIAVARHLCFNTASFGDEEAKSSAVTWHQSHMNRFLSKMGI